MENAELVSQKDGHLEESLGKEEDPKESRNKTLLYQENSTTMQVQENGQLGILLSGQNARNGK